MNSFYRSWGKAGDSLEHHFLVLHCLDVAAAGHCMMEAQPLLSDRLAHITGLGADRLVGLVAFLLAAHDIRKFADGFQGLQGDLLELLQARATDVQYDVRHDALGLALWEQRLLRRLDDRLARCVSGDRAV